MGDRPFLLGLKIRRSKLDVQKDRNERWNSCASRDFSIESNYINLVSMKLEVQQNMLFPWESIWKVKVPLKVSFFSREATQGCSIAFDNLQIKKKTLVKK